MSVVFQLFSTFAMLNAVTSESSLHGMTGPAMYGYDSECGNCIKAII
jgi:hypothetical protein